MSVSAQLAALFAALRSRIKPVLIDTAAHAGHLGRIIAALRFLPRAQHAGGPPITVLVQGRGDVLFLRGLRALRLMPPIKPRWTPDLDVLEAILAALPAEHLSTRLIVASEVYVRFYATFAAHGLTQQLRIV